MRGCPPTVNTISTIHCDMYTTTDHLIISKKSSTKKEKRWLFVYVLFGVVSTFEGGKLLQFPVLAEVESWWTLSTLLLYNLWPTWVLNFVELSGRWSAVARTLAGCLLGLGKNTVFRIKMGTLYHSMQLHHYWLQKVRLQCLLMANTIEETK